MLRIAKIGSLAICVMAVLMTVFAPLVAFGATVGVLTASAAVGAFAPNQSGVASAGLNKELWLAEIMEGFYSDDMFLSECRDLSSFVENDILNLAEAGVTPDVLINNTTYPIDVNDRTDTPIALTIDRFDTENTMIQKADEVELAYDKMKSVVYGHKQALREKIMQKAIHAIAPSTNGTYTPLLAASGANNGEDGNKALTWSDVRKLQKRFNNAKIPSAGRIIVFTEQHLSDLESEDLDRFNRVMDKGVICGFKIYTLADSDMPRYNKSTAAKVAFAAAPAGTDVRASVAFHKDEVGRAMGSQDMFHSKAENDPIYRRDVIGFAQRAMVLPIRNKGIAAIYSPAA